MVQATASIFGRDAAPTPATRGLRRWFQPSWSCGFRSPNFAELPVASSGHSSHVPRGQGGRLGGLDAVGPPGACTRVCVGLIPRSFHCGSCHVPVEGRCTPAATKLPGSTGSRFARHMRDGPPSRWRRPYHWSLSGRSAVSRLAMPRATWAGNDRVQPNQRQLRGLTMSAPGTQRHSPRNHRAGPLLGVERAQSGSGSRGDGSSALDQPGRKRSTSTIAAQQLAQPLCEIV